MAVRRGAIEVQEVQRMERAAMQMVRSMCGVQLVDEKNKAKREDRERPVTRL